MRVADLFCGAGGTSIGAHLTGGVHISFAVNHWDLAIETHSANFPKAKHVKNSLKWVHPSEAPKIDLLFASPECTHHSKARGGRPTSNQQRAGAWELLPWIEYHRPSFICVENVVEFRDWGPVGAKGKPLKSKKRAFFDSWINAITSAGYKVDFAELNAADFGAATSRNRLFVMARKGRREPWFPARTHSKDGSQDRPRWRGAIEIIDWSIPMPSVFARPKPLADKTLARIEKGLERHVEPMIVKLQNHDGNPVPTITTMAGPIIAVPFLTTYYGTMQNGGMGTLPTVTTKDRHAVTLAALGLPELPEPRSEGERRLQAKMKELGVLEIGFRMLSNPELANAQGFPLDYQFRGNKGEVTKQIGNSVCPPVAQALTESILSGKA